jgi:aryl-alcohol dehydrogenase-like predicted oxidoreductase
VHGFAGDGGERFSMKYRTYPSTDLTVSEVGFGLWTTSTGWWGEMTDEAAVTLIREAYDAGVTFFDAADTYGNGRSEEQLGTAFEGAAREKVVYATKFGYDFYNFSGERKGQQEIPADFSPAFVRFALEQSLKRLKTDYIDLYQVHNAHMEQVRSAELAGLMDAFVKEGKIRHWGTALGPAIGWLYEGIESAQRNITSVQMIWNMLEQFPGNQMVAAANDAGTDTGFVIRVPHSSGMLEGKYTTETVFEKGDHRNHRPKSWLINGVKKIETLRFLELPNRTLGQAAIQWLLAEPRTMSVLPNIYDREQLLEFAGASDTPRLTADELARVAELYAQNFGVDEEPGKYKGTMTPPESEAPHAEPVGV